MRLTTVILIATLMQVSAASLAQKVTYVKSDVTLRIIFKEITKQTGYEVLYANKNLNDQIKIDANFKDTPLAEVLDKCLGEQGVTYTIDDNKGILIKPKTPSFLDLPKPAFANIDARGKILDEGGKPLEGATVVLKGTNRTTKTDVKGEFVLANVPDDGVLQIRYVGYKPLEINLKEASMPLEIKLNVATGELEEVKVEYATGYQTLNKERATGSFVQIDNKLFNRSVSTNILDRINGVASGLIFNSGMYSSANSQSPIAIRGLSTINANKQPLLVVDGFPYDGTSLNMLDILRNINPNDVESVTLLKDAAAASIWGARSGNGVIVITTKNGKYNQAMKIGFNSNINITAKPDQFYIPRMSSAEVVEFEKKNFSSGVFYPNDDSYPSFGYYPQLSMVTEILLAKRRGEINDVEAENQLQALSKNDVRYDIDKYFYQKGINQQYAIDLSGGTSKYKYFGSIGYDNNRMSLVGNSYNRVTMRYDNTYTPIKNLELNVLLNYTKAKSNSNSFFSNMPIYSKLADENGNSLAIPIGGLRYNYAKNPGVPGLLDWLYRPLDEQKLNDQTLNEADNRITFGVKYTMIPGLTAEVKYQYQQLLGKSRVYQSTDSYGFRNIYNQYLQLNTDGSVKTPVPYGGMLGLGNNELVSQNIRGQLNYNRSWKNHSITALAGAEAREVNTYSNSVSYLGYDINTGVYATNLDYLTQYALRGSGNLGSIPRLAGNIGETVNRYLSYFANAAYTYDSRYTLSASARMDGSNFFGIKANQRITPLWSTGMLWNIAKEEFYKIEWLPTLKLRATYGFNGNMYNSVTAYPTIAYGGNPNSLTGSSYASVQSPGNPELRWEKVGMLNFGIDFGSKNDRLTGSLEYYRKSGIDLIGPILTDATVGFTNFMGNRASIKGQGVDLTLSLRTLAKKFFRWNSNLLLSYNIDKVVSYESIGLITAGGIVGGGPMIGKPIYALYSYRFTGLSPVNGAPLLNLNNESVPAAQSHINSGPENTLYHGSSVPVWFGSLMNSFDYKNWSFSFNLYYKGQYYFRRNSIQYRSLDGETPNGHADYSLRWKQPGDELLTSVPAYNGPNGTADALYANSSILVERGDHIRLRDARLGYQLNKNDVKSLPFKNIQLFLYANNLGMLWKYNDKGIDPDFGDSSFPAPLSFAIGLNANF